MIQDDEKYKSLRDSLKSLPKLRAKKDFEARLFQRIRDAEKGVSYTPVKKERESVFAGWLSNLFRPSFAPALGLTVVLLITVVVYFAYFSKLNDSGLEESRQLTTSTNQGDLVIYVKKDTGSYSGNYPKEYSAISPSETVTEHDAAPMESPSDFFARPETPVPTDGLIKLDKISEEQGIEMQRRSDPEKKEIETKGERKGDDVIMKKESKGDFKKEGDNSPFNIRDEKSNKNNEGEINQEQKVAPKSEDESTRNKLESEEKQKGYDKSESELKDSNRISRAIKDSIKTKKEEDTIQTDDNK